MEIIKEFDVCNDRPNFEKQVLLYKKEYEYFMRISVRDLKLQKTYQLSFNCTKIPEDSRESIGQIFVNHVHETLIFHEHDIKQDTNEKYTSFIKSFVQGK